MDDGGIAPLIGEGVPDCMVLVNLDYGNSLGILPVFCSYIAGRMKAEFFVLTIKIQ